MEAKIYGVLKMSERITIVDYGIGNLWSVRSALSYLNCDSKIVDSPEEVAKSDALLLPGVGSFRKAMEALRSSGMDEAVLEAVNQRGSKILGICLGMQLLAQRSTEDGETNGLGLIPTDVNRFDIEKKAPLKVPHIGFNRVKNDGEGKLFRGIDVSADFYFVHSYRLLPHGLDGHCAVCEYGEDFLAAYEYDNIFATQFHPEKSQTNGLKLLYNFINS